MATLRLDVHCTDVTPAIGLIAELRAVDDTGRSRITRKFAVVAGTEHPIKDLEPGTWEVRILAPARPMVSGEVDLAADADKRLTLRIGKARTTKPIRQPESSSGRLSGFATLSGDDYRSGESALRQAHEGLQAITLQVKAEETRDVVERWRALARCVDGQITPRRALAAREIQVTTKPLLGEPVELAFDEIFRLDRRIFATVRYENRRRLHAVPVPFWSGLPNDVVRLRADLNSYGALRSGIELEEPMYAGVVAYLASGAVVAAAELAQKSILAVGQRLLRDKVVSPIGACAAAYVLIGSSELGDDASWQTWIGNLRSWFPEVPDGAILEARLRLLTASTGEQFAEVADLLREAVERGLPYYTVGIGWLAQSLRHFPDDALLSNALPWIERVATAVDMDQPFTTLLIGNDR